ncbi:MAG TPA: DNA adenine methylase [Phycisphaerae bacterium]|nr:DNA adenine methylase [Phycisphaerae bacterium]
MGAIRHVPHPFPCQGSKRQLASQIVECIPRRTNRLIEPFAGSGAVTIATAYLKRANRFWLNDLHEPLVQLWKAIIQQPERLADLYERLWMRQRGRERDFYDKVRGRFNRTQHPQFFLYLLARCVKAVVRYNAQGQFNNSPDNRRLGTRPDSMRLNILQTAGLLRGRTRVSCRDFKSVLSEATPDDVVYMDPPYQGVCNTRDHRYCGAVSFHGFSTALRSLNDRGVPKVFVEEPDLFAMI